jgi:hypothetical protein
MIKRLFSLLLLLTLLALPSFAQVSVSGNLKTILGSGYKGDAFVRFRLRNFQGIPRIGSGIIVQQQVDVRPDVNGLISATIYGNDVITPTGTYYTVEYWQGGLMRSTANYRLEGASASLNTLSPLVVAPPQPSLVISPTVYRHTQSVAATTWTIVHNMGSEYPIVQAFDATGATIFPDTTTALDANTIELTFSPAQAGSATLIAGQRASIQLTDAPNAVITNPSASQTITQPGGTSLDVNGDFNVTGSATFDAVNANSISATSGTFSTLSVGTLSSVQSLSKRFYCETYAGADADDKINACLTAASAVSGIADATGITGAQTANATITVSTSTTLLLGDISLTSSASPAINLSGSGAALVGAGPNRTVLFTSSATGDIVQTNGAFFWVEGIGYRVATAVVRTNGAGLRVKSGNGGGRNMRFDATYNGISIIDNGSGGNFQNIQMGSGLKSGGNWNAGILIGGVPSGTVTSSQFVDIGINSSEAFTDAMISIRDGADAITFLNTQAVQGGVDAIPLKLSKITTGGEPEWIKFTNCYFEAGNTQTGILITASRNTEFSNCYITTSRVGMDVNGAVSGVIWQGMLTNIQREGFKLQTGGVDIRNSWIGDTSLETTNTYDSISVSAGASDWRVSGNTFASLLGLATTARYHINIAAGASSRFWITDNNFAQFGTGAINNGAAGSQQYIWANYPTSVANRVDNATSFNAAATFNSGITVASGVSNGTGVKHQRFGATTATTAVAGNSTTNAFSWGAAFADTNYTVSCSGVGPTGTPSLDISAKSASQVTVRTTAITAVASSYSAVNCIAIHD